MENKPKKIRLLQKTSRIFILISSILMIMSAVFIYFYTNYLIEQQIEEDLYSRRFRLEHYLEDTQKQIELSPIFEVKEVRYLHPETLKDTLIYDPSQDEKELFRELTSFKKVKNKNYQVIVRSMMVESQDISLAILFSFLITILIIFLIQYFFSKAWNKRVWKPFFVNLDHMKSFSLSSEKSIKLEESDVLEFSELKEEISGLTQKVTSDYQLLKQFTEDVSHELQTPLAIMQAKIENLLDDSKMNQLQYEHITSLQKDIQRLAKLNKKLVLITKIENRQFVKIETVSLHVLIEETIDNFKELSTIPIAYVEKYDLKVKADPQLIQILLNNLLSNAIKYGDVDGEIELYLTSGELKISNAGGSAIKNSKKLFTRFYKESRNVNKGTGLGLAIVKKVCDLYGYSLEYHFSGNLHVFSIYF